MLITARYLVVDAPGHHGDKVKVYRVSRTVEAARRYVASSPLLAIARDLSGCSTRKGSTIWRDVPLTFVR